MDNTLDALEEQRITLQGLLDAKKTQADRNRLGQFATPTALALDILSYARTLLPSCAGVRFLDPAFGTGAFYFAARKVFQENQLKEALGFEIDSHYGTPAASLWNDDSLRLQLTDFTREEPSARFNLIICNPPYVRHHHLENLEKCRLQSRVLNASAMRLSGLAGLYCYFMGLSHAWMSSNCIAGWLIPSEFMDVNYGEGVKRYLLNQVTLLRIHRFDPNDVQFADALVSSAIVWFRNAPPPRDHSVTFTFGGSILDPKVSRSVSSKALACEAKWTRFPELDTRSGQAVPTLSCFFHIKRGIATGCNDYFILEK
ncbi:MAG: Eco57I restriction-modification methylase domain-containing protein [Planctomycetes bacterium]|nr:Eco57I restriction-modification methylase domain-containing protein [Planctomycetota bacterium]